MILAIDWDDTSTTYPLGIRELCKVATEVHIITLNQGLDLDKVTKVLGDVTITAIHKMPMSVASRGVMKSVGTWKAGKCKLLGVDLMIDDMAVVVDECIRQGIPAIQVEGR